MFIRHFLKYFKPHKWRLAIAVVCMGAVGLLAAAPMFAAKEAIDILTRATDDGEAAVAAATPDSVRQAMDVLNKNPTAEDEGGEPSIRERVDATLSRWFGRTWTTPRDWVDARAERWQDWYHAQSDRDPLRALAILAAIIVVLTALKGLCLFLSKYELAYTFFYSNMCLREDLLANVLRQDYLFFNSRSTGYLRSRISSDVRAVQMILQSVLSDAVQEPITIVCMAAVLLWISWPLTLGVLLVAPPIAGLLYYIARVLRKNTRLQKKQADQLASVLTESLNNIRLVKAFGTEQIEIDKFHVNTLKLFRYMIRRRVAKFGSSPIMELIGSVAMGGVLMTGGWMILRPGGGMQFADFLIFLWALSRFYRPLKKLATLTGKYQEGRVAAERMLEILQMEPEVRETSDAQPFERLERSVEFESVGFRYADKAILSDISLRVEAGQTVAFAGPSGGGKTTLLNLLARLFDPSEGRILVDGHDLRKMSLTDWRRRLAIVTQETMLFDDTIERNIAYGMGDDDVDRARIETCARAAHAHDFIMELDGGLDYQTRVGPAGARLSGGQRQRLAIARALYRDPALLILDEATSALDAESQALVQDALARLMVGRTTFVIAHRISTIRNADCIYVLDKGRVVERGTHNDLVAAGGLYTSMVRRGIADEAPPESPNP